MAPQRVPTWFEIAQQVDTLLALPGARERFQQRVKEAAAEWLQRSDQKQQREEARHEAVKRTGVPYGSGLLPVNPKDGSFHWLEDFHDGKPPIEAWLSAKLSPDLDPDDSLPLPVPSGREVSLADRYAVLAAVWDAHWKGNKKISLWGDDDFCQEGFRYWFMVHANNPNLYPEGLSDQDAAIVETWIADVEADLSDGKPATPSETEPLTRKDDGPPKERLTVNLKRKEVAIDGEQFDVSSDLALRWVRVLAKHPHE